MHSEERDKYLQYFDRTAILLILEISKALEKRILSLVSSEVKFKNSSVSSARQGRKKWYFGQVLLLEELHDLGHLKW